VIATPFRLLTRRPRRSCSSLLSEKARMGNVSAIRALLVREEQKDPRRAALALFEEMAARRQ
jgi:hypothetical protein